MHRTDTHVRRLLCKDVAASFQRHRTELVEAAKKAGAVVTSDDGVHFYAEAFDCCKSRLVFHAGAQGFPFANGPCVTRRHGAVSYETLFLPKA